MANSTENSEPEVKMRLLLKSGDEYEGYFGFCDNINESSFIRLRNVSSVGIDEENSDGPQATLIKDFPESEIKGLLAVTLTENVTDTYGPAFQGTTALSAKCPQASQDGVSVVEVSLSPPAFIAPPFMNAPEVDKTKKPAFIVEHASEGYSDDSDSYEEESKGNNSEESLFDDDSEDARDDSEDARDDSDNTDHQQDVHAVDSQDRLSNLPPSIIEDILSLLSIKEAVKTSVLSKDWMYRWHKLHKLEFSEKTHKEHDVCRCIYQVLMLHNGPITEFSLTLETASRSRHAVIDTIIKRLWLKDNTIEKFTLKIKKNFGYFLPASLFKLSHLTHLHIRNCAIRVEPPFTGFSKLMNLIMEDVKMSARSLLHLILASTTLKRFSVRNYRSDERVGDDKPKVLELFESLPVIEEVTIDIGITECFSGIIDGIKFPCLLNLKSLVLINCSLALGEKLSLLFLLTRGSPNLERLRIKMAYEDVETPTFEAYADISLHHLKQIVIEGFKSDSEPHMEFLKLILAESSLLEEIALSLGSWVKIRREHILKILLGFPRAPRGLEIMIYQRRCLG